MVPYGDRSGVVIEPWLTDQWYCDAKTLAKPAIEAVERGATVFVPRSWENTFSNGCATSSPGAFRGKSGGAIRFPPGMLRTARSSRRNRGSGKKQRRARIIKKMSRSMGRRRARHLVPLGTMAVLDARLARGDDRTYATTRPTCWSPASTSSSSGLPA